MKIKSFFLISFYLGFSNLFFSQVNDIQSPEVSSFFKYKNIELQGSSGLLDLKIPIFEIKTNNLVLPIYIYYNSKGVRIEEESGNFGTSWSSFHSGMVKRQVNGVPDEFNSSCYLMSGYDPSSGATICMQYNIRNNTSWFNNKDNSQQMADYYIQHGNLNGYIGTNYNSYYYSEPEPDLFDYILPTGESGIFILNNQNSVLTNNVHHKINFDINTDGIYRISIKDIKGNLFIFEDTELRYNDFWEYYHGSTDARNSPILSPANYQLSNNNSLVPCSEGSNDAYNSDVGAFNIMRKPFNVAWHLTKVITSENRTINYYYDLESHTTLSNTSYKYNQKVASYNDAQGQPINREFIMSNRLDRFKAKRIKEINFQEGMIKFNYKLTKREDVLDKSTILSASETLGELRAIDNIVIQDLNGKIVKKVDFLTSYRISNGIDNVNNNQKYLYKRLWLDGIRINNQEDYLFIYNNTSLPYKFSFEQDYWGYYNNNNAELNGKTLLGNLWFYPSDNRSYTKVTNFSFFKRNSFTGNESRISNNSIFSDVAQYVSDRNVNENVMKAGVLEKVVYPTKGYDIFEYESNEYVIEGVVYKGFGLRLAANKSYDFNNVLINHNRYEYVEDNNLSSGRVVDLNVLGRISSFDSQNNKYLYSISSSPINGSVVYKQVNIDFRDGGQKKTKYNVVIDLETENALNFNGDYLYKKKFNIVKEWIQCYSRFRCQNSYTDYASYAPPLNNKEFTTKQLNFNYENFNGDVLDESFYSNNGDLVKKITYEYQLGINSKKQNYSIGINTNSSTFYPKTFILGNFYLKKKVTRDFSITNTSVFVENIKEFAYNTNNQVTLTKQIDSEGNEIKTTYEYADSNLFQFNFSVSDMKTLNMIGYPIVETVFKNNSIISKKYNEYYSNNNNPSGITNPVVLQKTYELEINKPINNFQEFNWYDMNSPSFGTIDSRLKVKNHFSRYDSVGNLLEFSKVNGAKTCLIWGYNNSKVIAKIENLDYSSISQSVIDTLQSLSNADNDNCTSGTCNEQTLRNALNNLRALYPQSLITTYTHDPLIGVTSITDERGKTGFYQYDEQSRLQFIRDNEGNILKGYEYHYKSN